MQRLSRIVGFLLSDGGVSWASKNLYEIYLTNNSEVLLETFKKDIISLFGEQRFYEYQFKTVKKVKVISREISNVLFKLSPSFRKRRCYTYPKCNKNKKACLFCKQINGYPPVIIPDFIFSDNKLKTEFLKVVFSADGCVEMHKCRKKQKTSFLQRRVSLSCYNPHLLSQYENLILSLGFNISKTKYEIRIAGKEQLIRFQKKIGFLKGVKACLKNKNNVTKNKLLQKAITSYL